MKFTVWRGFNRALVILLWTATYVPATEFEDAKCSACGTIVQELVYAIEAEKSSQNIDLLTRLNSKGERKGKVVDWKLSEVRAIELQEGICDNMLDYRIVGDEGSGGKLKKMAGGKESARKLRMLGGGLDQNAQNLIFAFCSDLLEEHEELILATIRKSGGDDAIIPPMTRLQEELCVARSGVCDAKESMSELRTTTESDREEAKKNDSKQNKSAPKKAHKKENKKKDAEMPKSSPTEHNKKEIRKEEMKPSGTGDNPEKKQPSLPAATGGDPEKKQPPKKAKKKKLKEKTEEETTSAIGPLLDADGLAKLMASTQVAFVKYDVEGCGDNCAQLDEFWENLTTTLPGRTWRVLCEHEWKLCAERGVEVDGNQPVFEAWSGKEFERYTGPRSTQPLLEFFQRKWRAEIVPWEL